MKVTILALLCIIGAVSALPSKGVFNYPIMGYHMYNPFLSKGYWPGMGVGMNAGLGFGNAGFGFGNAGFFPGFAGGQFFGGAGGAFLGGKGVGRGYYCKSTFKFFL
ncbi:hypothetical protein KUTeg_004873 [Tegillarca granosa]|uniref:Uncharacterized protein n=1 Tax=Tegillarca granosa TaxID=220873 RepID=A0ABQ9FI48_TEGGR|nr:hypothetical protein KUTeg_004873 [Tegillarca granosa]